MKKLIFILIGFFAFSGIAFANITTDLASPQVFDTTIQVNCLPIGDDLYVFFNNEYTDDWSCATTLNFTPDAVGIYDFIQCDHVIDPVGQCNQDFADEMRLDGGFIDEISFTWNGQQTGLSTTGIFYTRTDGHSDASSLVASVATATGSTTASIGPIIAIILGIILAFILIRKIIGLFYATKDTKDNK